MDAMLLESPAAAEHSALTAVRLDDPHIAADEILVDVSVCGVCRTDLHIVEADLELPTLPIVPGHQVIGRVAELGPGVTRFDRGERVGVAWVNRFCGQCEHCTAGRENLCLRPVFTGFHRHGGYSTRVAVPAAFAHPIPDALGSDVDTAPLLCAGIIGYRALKQSGLRPGSRLALYGFGASAHIALQIARAWGCEVYVVSRSADALDRARGMGATWTGTSGDRLPTQVDHAVSFAPAGAVIPEALEALRGGGTLALAGIYVDRVPPLDYERHLFEERSIVSVTANTRKDAAELLQLAGNLNLRTDVETYPMSDANEALARLKGNRLGAQAAVLTMGSR